MLVRSKVVKPTGKEQGIVLGAVTKDNGSMEILLGNLEISLENSQISTKV